MTIPRLLPWTLVAVAALVGCATVPYTNRSQLLMTSESEEVELGADVYREVLKKEKVVTDPAIVAPVREVGKRIAAVANRPDYEWEFNVIDAPKVANASVLPGGKVLVYSGLFAVAQDTAGLAAVLAHEVGHAIARHGGERMSQGTMVQLGQMVLGTAVAFSDSSPAAKQGIMAAFGLGAQYGVMLPFSRSQESEADHIGMILMAKAGYDPEAALRLWERFASQGGGAPPEFLSTHPSYTTRQQTISGWLPEARGYLTKERAPVSRLPKVGGAG